MDPDRTPDVTDAEPAAAAPAPRTRSTASRSRTTRAADPADPTPASSPAAASGSEPAPPTEAPAGPPVSSAPPAPTLAATPPSPAGAADTANRPVTPAPAASSRSTRRESSAAARRSAEPATTELSTSGFRIGDPRPGSGDPAITAATYEVPVHADPRPGSDSDGPTVPTNIYRARRPGAAVLLILPALAVGFLLVRGLAIAAFGQQFMITGVIASALGLAALPPLVAGLYGLMTGAAHGAEQYGFKVWARPPLAYLVVGLVLALASALAAH